MQSRRDRAQPLGQTEIAAQVLSLKACAEIAVVISWQIRFEVSTQETPSEYAISSDRNTEGTTRSQNLSLEPPLKKRVLDLEIHDRMHCRRASHRVGGNLRQRDVADIAGHHEIGDGANRVLDGHRGIEPSRPIDVDVVHAKPLQRISDEISERGRTIVEPIQTAVRITQYAKLNAENRLVSPAAF